VSLLSPDAILCRHCRYSGPPSPSDAQKIREAAAVVGSLDQRQRQFSFLRRKASAGGIWHLVSLLWASFPLAAAAAIVSWLIRKSYGRDIGTAAFSLTVGVALLVLALGVVVLAVKHFLLRQACTAQPPEAPGEPASCFLCGAPLPAPVRGVARCHHCATDNVVPSSLLQRTHQHVVQSLDHLAADVRRRARAARSTTVWLVVALTLVVAVTPTSLLLVLVPLDEWAKSQPVRFTSWPRDETRCIAQIHTDLWRREFVGFETYRSWQDFDRYESKPTSRPFTPKSLVGKDVIGFAGQPGRVVAVKPSISDKFSLVLEYAEGQGKVDAVGACFAEPPPPRRIALLRGIQQDDPCTHLAVSRSHVAFGAGRKLMLVERSTGSVQTRATADTVFQVEVVGDAFLARQGDVIVRFDPSAEAQLVELARTASHDTSPVAPKTTFAVDDAFLYYVAPSRSIARRPLGGGDEQTIATSSSASALAVHGDTVVWAEGKKLLRAPKAGGGRSEMIAEASTDVYGGPLFYDGASVLARQVHDLVRIPIGKGAPKLLADSTQGVVFARGAEGIVWGGSAPRGEYRKAWLPPGVRLLRPGSQAFVTVASNVGRVLSVGVQNDRVFWVAGAPVGSAWETPVMMERPIPLGK
jgi:hypothetical protein